MTTSSVTFGSELTSYVVNRVKYKLTENQFVLLDGTVLHQIVSTFKNPHADENTYGGWIQHEGNLSHYGDCWIGPNVIVYGEAVVRDNAFLYGHNSVSEHALIEDDAEISGNANISGWAVVRGSVRVAEDATITGTAIVEERAEVLGDKESIIDGGNVYGDCKLSGSYHISDKAQVFGNCKIETLCYIYENAKVYGRCFITKRKNDGGTSTTIETSDKFKPGVHLHGSCEVYGNVWISDSVDVSGHAKIFGGSTVSNYAIIKDYAIVRDQATVTEQCTLAGNTTVGYQSIVRGSAVLFGTTRVLNYAIVEGHALICGFGKAKEGVIISGNTRVSGHATILGSIVLNGSYPVEHLTLDGMQKTKCTYYDYESQENKEEFINGTKPLRLVDCDDRNIDEDVGTFITGNTYLWSEETVYYRNVTIHDAWCSINRINNSKNISFDDMYKNREIFIYGEVSVEDMNKLMLSVPSEDNQMLIRDGSHFRFNNRKYVIDIDIAKREWKLTVNARDLLYHINPRSVLVPFAIEAALIKEGTKESWAQLERLKNSIAVRTKYTARVVFSFFDEDDNQYWIKYDREVGINIRHPTFLGPLFKPRTDTGNPEDNVTSDPVFLVFDSLIEHDEPLFPEYTIDSGVTWNPCFFSIDSGLSWLSASESRTVSITEPGRWFFDLPNGVFTPELLMVRYVDDNGISSSHSRLSYTVTIDVGIDDPLWKFVEDTGQSNTDLISSKGEIDLGFNPDDKVLSVKFSLDGGTTWQKSGSDMGRFLLEEGTYEPGAILAEARDLAGSVVVFSNPTKIVVDKTVDIQHNYDEENHNRVINMMYPKGDLEPMDPSDNEYLDGQYTERLKLTFNLESPNDIIKSILVVNTGTDTKIKLSEDQIKSIKILDGNRAEVTIDVSGIPDGLVNAISVLEDEAGNKALLTETFLKDVKTTMTIDLINLHDRGIDIDDYITNIDFLRFTGNVENGATLDIFHNGNLVKTFTHENNVRLDGNNLYFEVDLNLIEGMNNILFFAYDIHGNINKKKYNILVDLTAPTYSFSQLPMIFEAGVLQIEGITQEPSMALYKIVQAEDLTEDEEVDYLQAENVGLWEHSIRTPSVFNNSPSYPAPFYRPDPETGYMMQEFTLAQLGMASVNDLINETHTIDPETGNLVYDVEVFDVGGNKSTDIILTLVSSGLDDTNRSEAAYLKVSRRIRKETRPTEEIDILLTDVVETDKYVCGRGITIFTIGYANDLLTIKTFDTHGTNCHDSILEELELISNSRIVYKVGLITEDEFTNSLQLDTIYALSYSLDIPLATLEVLVNDKINGTRNSFRSSLMSFSQRATSDWMKDEARQFKSITSKYEPPAGSGIYYRLPMHRIMIDLGMVGNRQCTLGSSKDLVRELGGYWQLGGQASNATGVQVISGLGDAVVGVGKHEIFPTASNNKYLNTPEFSTAMKFNYNNTEHNSKVADPLSVMGLIDPQQKQTMIDVQGSFAIGFTRSNPTMDYSVGYLYREHMRNNPSVISPIINEVYGPVELAESAGLANIFHPFSTAVNRISGTIHDSRHTHTLLRDFGIWDESDLFSETFERETQVSFGLSANYIFTTTADDSGKIFLDGVLVMDSLGFNAPPSSVSVFVEKGIHTIKIQALNDYTFLDPTEPDAEWWRNPAQIALDVYLDPATVVEMEDTSGWRSWGQNSRVTAPLSKFTLEDFPFMTVTSKYRESLVPFNYKNDFTSVSTWEETISEPLSDLILLGAYGPATKKLTKEVFDRRQVVFEIDAIGAEAGADAFGFACRGADFMIDDTVVLENNQLTTPFNFGFGGTPGRRLITEGEISGGTEPLTPNPTNVRLYSVSSFAWSAAMNNFAVWIDPNGSTVGTPTDTDITVTRTVDISETGTYRWWAQADNKLSWYVDGNLVTVTEDFATDIEHTNAGLGTIELTAGNHEFKFVVRNYENGGNWNPAGFFVSLSKQWIEGVLEWHTRMDLDPDLVTTRRVQAFESTPPALYTFKTKARSFPASSTEPIKLSLRTHTGNHFRERGLGRATISFSAWGNCDHVLQFSVPMVIRDNTEGEKNQYIKPVSWSGHNVNMVSALETAGTSVGGYYEGWHGNIAGGGAAALLNLAAGPFEDISLESIRVVSSSFSGMGTLSSPSPQNGFTLSYYLITPAAGEQGFSFTFTMELEALIDITEPNGRTHDYGDSLTVQSIRGYLVDEVEEKKICIYDNNLVTDANPTGLFIDLGERHDFELSTDIVSLISEFTYSPEELPGTTPTEPTLERTLDTSGLIGEWVCAEFEIYLLDTVDILSASNGNDAVVIHIDGVIAAVADSTKALKDNPDNTYTEWLYKDATLSDDEYNRPFWSGIAYRRVIDVTWKVKSAETVITLTGLMNQSKTDESWGLKSFKLSKYVSQDDMNKMDQRRDILIALSGNTDTPNNSQIAPSGGSIYFSGTAAGGDCFLRMDDIFSGSPDKITIKTMLFKKQETGMASLESAIFTIGDISGDYVYFGVGNDGTIILNINGSVTSSATGRYRFGMVNTIVFEKTEGNYCITISHLDNIEVKHNSNIVITDSLFEQECFTISDSLFSNPLIVGQRFTSEPDMFSENDHTTFNSVSNMMSGYLLEFSVKKDGVTTTLGKHNVPSSLGREMDSFVGMLSHPLQTDPPTPVFNAYVDPLARFYRTGVGASRFALDATSEEDLKPAGSGIIWMNTGFKIDQDENYVLLYQYNSTVKRLYFFVFKEDDISSLAKEDFVPTFSVLANKLTRPSAADRITLNDTYHTLSSSYTKVDCTITDFCLWGRTLTGEEALCVMKSIASANPVITEEMVQGFVNY
jgi:UDP-3-O-[3-hydroxymyristoyl] glucosamine N-acyltransferase